MPEPSFALVAELLSAEPAAIRFTSGLRQTFLLTLVSPMPAKGCTRADPQRATTAGTLKQVNDNASKN